MGSRPRDSPKRSGRAGRWVGRQAGKQGLLSRRTSVHDGAQVEQAKTYRFDRFSSPSLSNSAASVLREAWAMVVLYGVWKGVRAAARQKRICPLSPLQFAVRPRPGPRPQQGPAPAFATLVLTSPLCALSHRREWPCKPGQAPIEILLARAARPQPPARNLAYKQTPAQTPRNDTIAIARRRRARHRLARARRLALGSTRQTRATLCLCPTPSVGVGSRSPEKPSCCTFCCRADLGRIPTLTLEKQRRSPSLC